MLCPAFSSISSLFWSDILVERFLTPSGFLVEASKQFWVLDITVAVLSVNNFHVSVRDTRLATIIGLDVKIAR